MKYVCKNMFVRVVPLGDGKFVTVDVHCGDVLEYIGMDDYRNCEFKTDGGYCIRMSSKAVDDLLEELSEPVYYKLLGLLNRLSKIESEIAELREELKEIMEDMDYGM